MKQEKSIVSATSKFVAVVLVALALVASLGLQAGMQDYAYAAQSKAATTLVSGTAKATTKKAAATTTAKKSIMQVTIPTIPTQTYTGKPICPVSGLKDGAKSLRQCTDYLLYYHRNIYVGTASVKIVGMGNYTGSRTVTFKIAKSLTQASVASIPTQTYTGRAIVPKLTVKYGGTTLRKGADYTVSHYNNTGVGTAAVVIKGAGNYKDSVRLTFKIAKSISHASVSRISDKTYTGKAIRPALTVRYGSTKLRHGIDYVLIYRNNVHPGTAQVTISGKGNYTGTRTVNFTIKNANGQNVEPASNVPKALTEAEYAARIFDEYNNFRASKGLPRVQWDETCRSYAQGSAQGCAARKALVHRLGIPSYAQTSYSDILAYATYQRDAHDLVFSGWANSSGHRKQMQCNTAERAAVGVYNDNGTWYCAIAYNFRGCNQSGN